MDDLQEFMKNFLIFGHAPTVEELDTRTDETIPKTPPTLNQFQQQVRMNLASPSFESSSRGLQGLISSLGEVMQGGDFSFDNIVCYSQFPRGGCHATQSHMGKPQSQLGGRGSEGPFCGFYQKEPTVCRCGPTPSNSFSPDHVSHFHASLHVLHF
jgi:hypothetical protein